MPPRLVLTLGIADADKLRRRYAARPLAFELGYALRQADAGRFRTQLVSLADIAAVASASEGRGAWPALLRRMRPTLVLGDRLPLTDWSEIRAWAAATERVTAGRQLPLALKEGEWLA